MAANYPLLALNQLIPSEFSDRKQGVRSVAAWIDPPRRFAWSKIPVATGSRGDWLGRGRGSCRLWGDSGTQTPILTSRLRLRGQYFVVRRIKPKTPTDQVDDISQ